MVAEPPRCSPTSLRHGVSCPERVRHAGLVHHGSVTVIVVRVVGRMSEAERPVIGRLTGCMNPINGGPLFDGDMAATLSVGLSELAVCSCSFTIVCCAGAGIAVWEGMIWMSCARQSMGNAATGCPLTPPVTRRRCPARREIAEEPEARETISTLPSTTW